MSQSTKKEAYRLKENFVPRFLKKGELFIAVNELDHKFVLGQPLRVETKDKFYLCSKIVLIKRFRYTWRVLVE